MLKHLSKGLLAICVVTLLIATPLAVSSAYSPFRDVMDIMHVTDCSNEVICTELENSLSLMFIRYDLPRVFTFIFPYILALYLLLKVIVYLFNTLRTKWKSKSSI